MGSRSDAADEHVQAQVEENEHGVPVCLGAPAPSPQTLSSRTKRGSMGAVEGPPISAGARAEHCLRGTRLTQVLLSQCFCRPQDLARHEASPDPNGTRKKPAYCGPATGF